MENNTENIELIRKHVDIIILRPLLDRDCYGYEILKSIIENSNGLYSLKQPTLYSCLKRLENQKKITSYLGDVSSGAQRRYYALTEYGRQFVEAYIKQWEYTRTILSSLISDKEFDINVDEAPFDASELRPLTRRIKMSDDELEPIPNIPYVDKALAKNIANQDELTDNSTNNIANNESDAKSDEHLYSVDEIIAEYKTKEINDPQISLMDELNDESDIVENSKVDETTQNDDNNDQMDEFNETESKDVVASDEDVERAIGEVATADDFHNSTFEIYETEHHDQENFITQDEESTLPKRDFVPSDSIVNNDIYEQINNTPEDTSVAEENEKLVEEALSDVITAADHENTKLKVDPEIAKEQSEQISSKADDLSILDQIVDDINNKNIDIVDKKNESEKIEEALSSSTTDAGYENDAMAIDPEIAKKQIEQIQMTLDTEYVVPEVNNKPESDIKIVSVDQSNDEVTIKSQENDYIEESNDNFDPQYGTKQNSDNLNTPNSYEERLNYYQSQFSYAPKKEEPVATPAPKTEEAKPTEPVKAEKAEEKLKIDWSKYSAQEILWHKDEIIQKEMELVKFKNKSTEPETKADKSKRKLYD